MAVVGRTEERDELSLCKELVAWVKTDSQHAGLRVCGVK